jgi:hypothetical protein
MALARRKFLKTTAAGALFGIAGGSRLDSWRLQSPISLPTQRAKALMELFGLKYPIFEAPHGRQTCPELVSSYRTGASLGGLLANIK